MLKVIFNIIIKIYVAVLRYTSGTEDLYKRAPRHPVLSNRSGLHPAEAFCSLYAVICPLLYLSMFKSNRDLMCIHPFRALKTKNKYLPLIESCTCLKGICEIVV